MLMEDTLGAFEALKKAHLEVPVLSFADFNEWFHLETDTRKLRLGAVLSQKQSWCLIPSGSQHEPVFNCSWA